MVLKKVAEFDGAADETTADNIREESSHSREAVVEVITPVAAGIISSNPTVIAAASAAVDDQIDEKDLLVGAYPVSPRNGKALILAARRRVLAAWRRSDGMLDTDTARAFGKRISDVGSVGASRRAGARYPWTHLWAAGGRVLMYIDRADGLLKYWDGQLVGGGTDTVLAEILGDGDSTTQGADLANQVEERWTTWLQTDLGIPVTNHGVSGNRAADIGAMAGTFIATATVTGGSIPATGSVTLTLDASPYYGTGNDVPAPASVDVYVPGGGIIPGTITRTGQTTVAFTPTGLSGAVAATTVEVQVTIGKPFRRGIRLISAGVNDEPGIVAGTTVIQDVKDRYLEYFTAQAGEVFSWGLLDRGLTEGTSSQYTGNPAAAGIIYDYIDEMEEWLHAQLGVRFIPVRKYLASTQALADAVMFQPGFTPTSDDNAAVAAGRVPPSFRSSPTSVHLNALGHRLQARFMGRHLRRYSTLSERFAS
ncbi:hypothetical protein [Microbacterium dauci]|uniref:Uncharacterized protein n=1 Tax=Microbacterium dauci TaxID=3048008 RepID=A0ABT6ZB79_9MICO|nr:hypothetical protein [Microbacterium sp. LX3-4]MDJ1113251.1 hypothetical protein [Microbacterium sp. LX3-4]